MYLKSNCVNETWLYSSVVLLVSTCAEAFGLSITVHLSGFFSRDLNNNAPYYVYYSQNCKPTLFQRRYFHLNSHWVLLTQRETGCVSSDGPSADLYSGSRLSLSCLNKVWFLSVAQSKRVKWMEASLQDVVRVNIVVMNAAPLVYRSSHSASVFLT